jgi:hypothetical protein
MSPAGAKRFISSQGHAALKTTQHVRGGQIGGWACRYNLDGMKLERESIDGKDRFGRPDFGEKDFGGGGGGEGGLF